MKEQEVSGLLSSLGIKTSLSEFPLLADILKINEWIRKQVLINRRQIHV